MPDLETIPPHDRADSHDCDPGGLPSGSTPATAMLPSITASALTMYPLELGEASRNADVLSALAAIDALRPLDIATEQALLLSIWRRIDRLEVARRAIETFAADLAWSLGEDNVEIAQRFRKSLVAFPELDLMFDRSVLLAALGRSVNGSPNLVGLSLAVLIDPDDLPSLDRLILSMRQAGYGSSVGRLLPLRLKHGCPSHFVAQFLRAGRSKRQDDDVDTLMEMLDRVGQDRGLAMQSLGLEIGRTAGLGVSDTTDPLRLATRLLSARGHVRRHRPHAAPAVPVTTPLRDRAAKLSGLIAKSSARTGSPSSPRSKPATSLSLSRYSVRGWVGLLLTHGDATIPASQFQTSYAEHASNAMLRAVRHPVDGSRFQYGPSVTLSRGVYLVTFLGEADPKIKLEMLVSSAYGSKTLATGLTLPAMRTAGALGELAFDVDDDSATCEFVLTCYTRSGRLESHGVTLRRVS